MEFTKAGDAGYEQTINPVVAPQGFSSPAFQIGLRVKPTYTRLNPLSNGRYDGHRRTARVIVLCKSGGKAVLYGGKLPLNLSDSELKFCRIPQGNLGGKYAVDVARELLVGQPEESAVSKMCN